MELKSAPPISNEVRVRKAEAVLEKGLPAVINRLLAENVSPVEVEELERLQGLAEEAALGLRTMLREGVH